MKNEISSLNESINNRIMEIHNRTLNTQMLQMIIYESPKRTFQDPRDSTKTQGGLTSYIMEECHNDCDKYEVGRRTLVFKLNSKPMKKDKDSAPAVVEAAFFPNANRIKEASNRIKYHARKPSKRKGRRWITLEDENICMKIEKQSPPKSYNTKPSPTKGKASNSNRMMIFAKRKPRLLPSQNSATQCNFQKFCTLYM